MAEAGVEAACLTNPVSIDYLAGVRIEPHERLMALAVRSDRLALVVPALERARAEQLAPQVEVRTWADGDNPFTVLAAALGPARSLGVEKDHLTLGRSEEIGLRLPDVRVVDLAPELRRLRAVKSAFEVGLLRRAAKLTDQLVERALASLRVGVTEIEVAQQVANAAAELGSSTAFSSLVQFGPRSAQPHLTPGERRLEPGDLALLDLGAVWQGYGGDITRVAVVGPPDPRQLEVWEVVLAAHDAAIRALRAGVSAGAVDARAREVIVGAGLGDYFIHRTGHGLGLEAHEAPSLNPGSDLVLEAGMVVTVEPGVYLPGWGGIRIEDTLLVEPAGARRLTEAELSLRVVPGT